MKDKVRGFIGMFKYGGLLVFTTVLSFVALVSIAVIAVKPIISFWTASPSALKETSIAEHIKMYDKNGTQFAEIWSSDRDPVSSMKNVSPYMKNAIISAEDKDFYSHGAINLPATIRSVLSSSGGGSGITQQLVKNLQYLAYDASEQTKNNATATTVSRKLQEMKMANNYEKTHTKDQILLEYLNTVSVGSANVYGIETASRTIFNKSAKDLTIGESAALAGSVNNTSKYNLLQMSDKTVAANVKKRQTYVLDRMLANGYINKKEHDDAVKAPITTNIQEIKGGCGNSAFPFYCQYVVNYMMQDPQLGATIQERQSRINKGGFAIHTALDPDLTRTTENQLKADLGTTNRVAMPIAAVQPGTGGVLTIASNRDWGINESAGQTEIPLATSPTQTGSTYKMITLATAVANGWTEDRLNQVDGYCPWTKAGYDTPPGGIGNSDSCALQGGKIGYKKATAYSSNTYYVELSTEVGIDKVIQMSKTLGLSVPSNITSRSASFTLGVASDSPIQMAAAYATFLNKGVYCPATPVRSYSMLDGGVFTASDSYDPSTSGCKAVLTPKQNSIVLKAQDANVNDTSISGRLGADAAVAGHDTIGKTGTTTNLANSTWSASVGQYAMFANAYDPRGNFAYPLTSYVWRGMTVNGYYHSAIDTVKSIMMIDLRNKPNISMDLNDNDDRLALIKTNNIGTKTVPDVTGMSPQYAIKAMNEAGFKAYVLKRSSDDDDSGGNSSTSYSKGTVRAQSIPSGTRLSLGSKRIVELSIIQ
jgi:membrane peptidoglycan carboxypeptidase